jgi:hypothetical protein
MHWNGRRASRKFCFQTETSTETISRIYRQSANTNMSVAGPSAARSHNREKSLSSSPTLCPHVSARLPLNESSWNLILGTFMKIRPGNTNSVTIVHFTLRPKQVLFLPWDIKSPYKRPLSSEMVSSVQHYHGGIKITRTHHNITITWPVLFNT